MRLLLFFLSGAILCFGERSEPPAGTIEQPNADKAGISSALVDGDDVCAEEEFHIGGNCVEEWNTRPCNGGLIHYGDLCNGCPEGRVIINGTCVWKDETRQCDGGDILRESLCNDKCEEGKININGTCVWKHETWQCDGVHILEDSPCNGKCRWQGRVIINDICVPIYDTWQCDGVPILLKDSCEGECADGRIKIDGNCVYKESFQLCNGSYISSNDICFGECDQDQGYVKFHGRCVQLCPRPHYLSQSTHYPCNGCKGGWWLVHGMCLMQSDTHMCNNQRLFIEDVCDGQCVKGRILVGGKCISLEDTWTCQGTIQPAVQPCSGKCRNTTLYNFQMPDNDNGANLTDYIICGEKCLLRSEVWDCKGTCQPHSVPCDGECLTGLIPAPDTEQYYYDNIGGICVLLVHIPDQFLVGSHLLLSSGITGISAQQSLAKLGVIWSCPPTHCRSARGLKCCKLVIAGNAGLRCPPFC